ncbi:MAG: hypothetical protein SWZ49_00775 [Cyanobacteriota bacterium]|nr:hypothetical protein [Cyanobacteriota bacterium]
MDAKTIEVKQIAAQLLAGLIANPHLYPTFSDEMARGQKEQDLILLAIGMARCLIEKADDEENLD